MAATTDTTRTLVLELLNSLAIAKTVTDVNIAARIIINENLK